MTGKVTGTFAAGDATTKVGNLSFTNSGALTVGTVTSPTFSATGITSTGTVLVETLSGDLALTQNINTTNATASAVWLNAGKSTAVGTTTGGDILITGPPTITVGTGGTIRLMGGSVSGSTGLTALVGSGTGRFRYNSDESTTNYSLALSPNVINAIYREQPTATVDFDSTPYVITYGDSLPTFSYTQVSAVNGDEGLSGYATVIPTATYSTSNTIKCTSG